jgi:hypothetical protein
MDFMAVPSTEFIGVKRIAKTLYPVQAHFAMRNSRIYWYATHEMRRDEEFAHAA